MDRAPAESPRTERRTGRHSKRSQPGEAAELVQLSIGRRAHWTWMDLSRVDCITSACIDWPLQRPVCSAQEVDDVPLQTRPFARMSLWQARKSWLPVQPTQHPLIQSILTCAARICSRLPCCAVSAGQMRGVRATDLRWGDGLDCSSAALMSVH